MNKTNKSDKDTHHLIPFLVIHLGLLIALISRHREDPLSALHMAHHDGMTHLRPNWQGWCFSPAQSCLCLKFSIIEVNGGELTNGRVL